METNKKIELGDIELDDSYLDPKNHKIRITTMIDGDVLAWLKNEAQHLNLGYQTILNMKLRQAMESVPVTVEEIKKAIKDVFDDGSLVKALPKSRKAVTRVPTFHKKIHKRKSAG